MADDRRPPGRPSAGANANVQKRPTQPPPNREDPLDARSTLPGMSTLRWRPEGEPPPAEGPAAPGAPGAIVAPAPAPTPLPLPLPASEVPAAARIAQPVITEPMPAQAPPPVTVAPLTLDETPLPRKFVPDPITGPGEMVWHTHVGPPPGMAPPPSTPAFVPVVTPAPPPPVAPLPAGLVDAPDAQLVMPGRVHGGETTAGAAAPRQGGTQVTVYKLERPVEFDKRAVLLREPDSEAAAAYRVLRHRLIERGNPRVIVVTSARPREGKTTCAVNLALALGECGRARVLLVEGNLRSPRLAEILAFMPPVCFGEQVATHRDQPEEPWTVVEAHSPWLHVAAVKPDVRDRPLIDGPAFAIAIDQLRHAGYDHVVIDTPAVLGSADVHLTLDCADGVVVVARARQTSGRYLRRAVEQLAANKILGLVLTDAPK